MSHNNVDKFSPVTNCVTMETFSYILIKLMLGWLCISIKTFTNPHPINYSTYFCNIIDTIHTSRVRILHINS